MNLVITFGGLHGTGKSTYSEAISKEFSLRYVSAGKLFRRIAKEKSVSLLELSVIANDDCIDRQIDEKTKQEAMKGSVVLDGILSGWMAEDHANLKIYLKASEKERINRITIRENTSYSEARNVTLLREKTARRRFKKLYDIDIDDLSIYDLIMNTGLLSVKSNIEVIKKFIQEYISNNRS